MTNSHTVKSIISLVQESIFQPLHASNRHKTKSSAELQCMYLYVCVFSAHAVGPA